MPPSKTATVRSKHASPSSSKKQKSSSKPATKAPQPSRQQKTKRPAATQTKYELPSKKLAREKTADQLGVPALNGIVPASGVKKPKGKKKGKIFVDDPQRMMMIYKIVSAEAEGKVEGKMMRQRQLEEIREARKAEMERREGERKGVLEGAKDDIRLKRKRKGKAAHGSSGGLVDGDERNDTNPKATKKKRVSFA